MMRKIALLIFAVLGGLLTMIGCGDNDAVITGPVGWAIGYRSDNTAAILHTANGGKNWEEQGNPALWTGLSGNDISAVDKWTAWAAVGGGPSSGGAILHTTDGGVTWNIQPLPEGINETVKGIKGLSRSVAWAVTLGGTVMRTLDGGWHWVVVPHDGVIIKEVNRIDAMGDDIWIADFGSSDGAMIHSADFGRTWRREPLPGINLVYGGPMGVSIVSSKIAWSAVKLDANLYRTTDGGATWRMDAPAVSGPNDIDDICAPEADMVWAVQNIGGMSGGRIIRVRLVNGKVISDTMDPMSGKYQYEGVTCFDEKTVWVVGFKAYGVDPGLPEGVILHTEDGTTWTSQTLPVSDVSLWKVSFAGAHR
ncbi:MAG: hypothetical protein KJ649_07005 [Proteobacteria bacterium]|nr:hypothetical protein [Pseudomonadota bacterium]